MWRQYCETNSIDPWAGSPEDLMAFLQRSYEETNSLSVVYLRLSTVSYFYRLKSLASPSSDPSVQMYMKGLKRRHVELGTQTRRAKPLTKEILHQLNDYLSSRVSTLREWRTIWRINLAFYGLLRWDDVMRLKVSRNASLNFYRLFIYLSIYLFSLF